MRVIIYTKPACHLCEDALDALDRLAPRYGLEIEQVNILQDPALYAAYHEKIPVVEIAGAQLEAPLDLAHLEKVISLTSRASVQLPPATSSKSVVVFRENGLDRTAAWVGGHWLRLVTLTLGIFTLLPWITPVFANLGWWGIADPLYTAYALTCHQLPERAGTVMGYQVAFCYRNTALYGGLCLFGLLYGYARQRRQGPFRSLLVPAPWWLFALLIMPMLVDGVTHMSGIRDTMLMPGTVPQFGAFDVGSQLFSLNWWLRVLTGLTAALGGVWFSFPRMDRAVSESEEMRRAYSLSTSTLTV